VSAFYAKAKSVNHWNYGAGWTSFQELVREMVEADCRAAGIADAVVARLSPE
jgi:hypothetical protein